MTYVLGIDSGSTQSAWALINDDYTIEGIGKDPNEEMLESVCRYWCTDVAIEMIASYGMPVGVEVFETVEWVGRFGQEILHNNSYYPVKVYRRDVKLNLCNSSKANDANVRQALVDRFAPGQPNHGKGTKTKPGWFYGFHSDIWAAYAVAVTHLDQLKAVQS